MTENISEKDYQIIIKIGQNQERVRILELIDKKIESYEDKDTMYESIRPRIAELQDLKEEINKNE